MFDRWEDEEEEEGKEVVTFAPQFDFDPKSEKEERGSKS